MTNNRIEKLCEQLLEEHGIDQPPVPIKEIAEAIGLTVHFKDFEGNNISGFLYRDKESDIIGVNSSHPSTRQRFTIAHEIGHFILHKRDTMRVDRLFTINFRNAVSATATSREEIEANAFAATILMPKKLVIETIGNMFKGTIDIFSDSEELDQLADQLAKDFMVSKQAMLIRLGKIGIL
jgi:Zn-dependent peptidase ImmA (M78 family)